MSDMELLEYERSIGPLCSAARIVAKTTPHSELPQQRPTARSVGWGALANQHTRIMRLPARIVDVRIESRKRLYGVFAVKSVKKKRRDIDALPIQVEVNTSGFKSR